MKPDAASISEYSTLLAEQMRRAGDAGGVEKDLVRIFCAQFAAGKIDPALPLGAADTLVFEMSFRVGRADIVVFHADGSATVIEAKDGANGATHVVAGIGQATLYAAQLGMSRAGIRKIRKCVMWSSTGDLAKDALIDHVIEEAGCISLSYPTIRLLVACERATLTLFAAAAEMAPTP